MDNNTVNNHNRIIGNNDKVVIGDGMEAYQYMIKIKNAFQELNSIKLREIANQAIEEAVLKSDKLLASVAVFAYALSKVLTKVHFRKRENWGRFKKRLSAQLSMFVGLTKTRKDVYGILENKLIKLVEEIDKEAGNYTRNLMYKAKVKMASTAYALGVSAGTAADLTGADKFELLRYIGITKIHDRPYTKTLSALERYKIARSVLHAK